MNIAAMLAQLGDHVELANMATKLGLPADQVEAAVASLAKAHVAPTDTLQTAAADTGLGVDQLRQIVEQIGGEGSLTRFVQLLNDESGGGGGLLGQIGSIAGGFLNNKG
ncbi:MULTISPECIES: hypothetical protein [unclassified Sphingomonas]|jgi:ATP phosphoribosyltransferase regulatory subunit HisZ|uniref:hypothetical protein n=1 Tax=unclassified Sphingomonas TaxID=196159 RepID=UPI0008330AB3|nr:MULTISPECIES: hypothetical protein [unclassified Sphingomonas]